MNNEIKCPKCGAAINGDSLYCNYCGAAVTDVRDLLKKKAEIELEKQQLSDKNQYERNNARSQLIKDLPRYIALILGLLVILFMCLMANGKI